MEIAAIQKKPEINVNRRKIYGRHTKEEPSSWWNVGERSFLGKGDELMWALTCVLFVHSFLIWIQFAERTSKHENRSRERIVYRETLPFSFWCSCATGTRWLEMRLVRHEAEKRLENDFWTQKIERKRTVQARCTSLTDKAWTLVKKLSF